MEAYSLLSFLTTLIISYSTQFPLNHAETTKSTQPHPHHPKNKKTMPSTHGWIWPKDPRPGNPSHWPRRWRLFDILRNRGPDIFVGRIHSDKKDKDGNRDKKRREGRVEVRAPIQQQAPRKRDCAWAGWEDVHPPTTTPDSNGSGVKTKYVYTSAFPWTTRKSNERYDFRTKRYTVPDSGTWSRAEYCSGDLEGHGWRRKKHVIPVRYWDRNGEMYPAGYWHDVVYGGHARCCDCG